ncbi:ATP-binding protein, partial [Clostridium saccharoperbutylacetonicum]
MKIEIDAKKISSSPNLFNYENTLDDETKEILNQLKQQLIFGNNSCFLISGYRGAGKTTLVNILKEEIKKSNNKTMFIHLNFSRYEDYSLVLRKLIREIYMTFLNNENYKEIEKKDRELVDSMKLLYERTFFEINNTSNRKMLTELDMKLESSFSIKDIFEKLGPSMAVIFAGVNLSFDFIPNVIKYFNIFLLFGSLVWFIYQSFKLNSYFEKKKTVISELSIKSLYDNEIAEFHLKNMLKDLELQDIKIVFVFDELDKIEKDDEMEKLISDFKPILLSGLASFIVISGQKLYYKFSNANILDDSIMASIFSKSIHIPLTINETLENLFSFYISDPTNLENELLKLYRDSLILNSNRTVRRFINIIIQDLTWQDGKAYLLIEEENIKVYKTDSIILNILNEVIEANIEDSQYDAGIKDFLAYQLFIWIKKMKLKGKVYFAFVDIFNFDENYPEIYPMWCKTPLKDLCNNLIKSLLENNLLESKEEIEAEEKVIYYVWTSEAEIRTEGTINNLDNAKSAILENMIELEKYCREIILDLNDEKGHYILPFNKLINELREINVIDIQLLYQIKNVTKISNKVRHGIKLTDIEENELYNCVSISKMLIYKLIESYCYYVVNSYISNKEYKINNNYIQKNVDFIAQNNQNNHPDLIFEVRYKNSFSGSDKNTIRNLIRKLNDYNLLTQKQNKLILLNFSKDRGRVFEK